VLALFDELATQRDELASRHDELASQRDELTTQRDELTEKLRERDELIAQYKRLLYARSSEKLTAEELGQLVMAYGGSPEAAAAEDPKVPVPEQAEAEPEEPPPEEKKKRRKHRGRTAIPPNIERVETLVRVPDDERGCEACGHEMTCIRHLEHSTLHYKPATLENHVELREVLVCKTPGCKCNAVTAERATPPKVKTRAGASLLALLLEGKCDDALPIHRQRDQLSRLGLEIPVDTLYGWWRYATDLLLPVCDALFGYILDDPCYVGIDDTGIDVLDRKTKGGKYRGHFWCFKGSRKMVAFMFTRTWSADEIAPWIHAIPPDIAIQVDDYAGYGRKFENPEGEEKELVPPERRLGCMMHVRRRFHAALKLGDKRAAVPMGIFKKIYEIEKRARGMSPEERLALRTKHSLPLLDELDAWIEEHEGKVGNTGKLAEAIRYAKNQREYIRRCFSDGRYEIDNGAVERQIREPALGRKNFYFTGSVPAARRLAGAYTLVQTCRLLGISTRDYLIDVIEKLEGGWPMRRLTELLPHNWAAARGLAVDTA
jgi:transposase